jgi:hypothetical protein
LDEKSINISSTSLRSALALSNADRRWIDFITQSVNDTWDEANPGRPKTLGYVGSEEFIRLQFEEYLLAMISSVKYHNYLIRNSNGHRIVLPQIDGDPSIDFSLDWIEAWTKTENYRIWQNKTDSQLFGFVEPKHPCAGGLTVDDVQRRIAQQVQDFHLDERFAAGKEVLGRNIAAGREKASTVFNKLYADMEALRETQRKRQEEHKALSDRNVGATPTAPSVTSETTRVQSTVQMVGSKAGAYMNSWAIWAGERRRNGWGRSSSSAPSTPAKDHGKTASTMLLREIESEKRESTESGTARSHDETRAGVRTCTRELDGEGLQARQVHALNHVVSDQVPT